MGILDFLKDCSFKSGSNITLQCLQFIAFIKEKELGNEINNPEIVSKIEALKTKLEDILDSNKGHPNGKPFKIEYINQVSDLNLMCREVYDLYFKSSTKLNFDKMFKI
ncbi:hypothetical protein N9A57_00980 [Candidatus Pelagibacter sp.]|nr:hypothetical protein [Candidatus Pelagibacter sp.]